MLSRKAGTSARSPRPIPHHCGPLPEKAKATGTVGVAAVPVATWSLASPASQRSSCATASAAVVARITRRRVSGARKCAAAEAIVAQSAPGTESMSR